MEEVVSTDKTTLNTSPFLVVDHITDAAYTYWVLLERAVYLNFSTLVCGLPEILHYSMRSIEHL
jgi:hypothetical protein